MATRRARRYMMCVTAVTTCIVVFSYNVVTVPTAITSTLQSFLGSQTRCSKVPVTNSSTLPSFPGPQPRGAKVPATTSNILPWPLGTQIPETARSMLDTNEIRRKIKLFDVMITRREKRCFEILLKTFMKAVASKVTYFLYSGSLLGSYRHHGMIPWDDDLDLVVRAKDTQRLVTSLSKLAPHFILNQQGGRRWKFYHRRSYNIPNYSWKWPFIDISFYKENRTHIRDYDRSFPRFVFKRTDVFPLGKRPFMGLLLPTPRNTKSVILQTYSISVCQNLHYDHRWERSIHASKQATLQCDLLKAIHPFVRREYRSNGTMEILERHNTRIGEFFLYDRDQSSKVYN
ncbi:uncharacterized protein RP688-like [Haliotis rufescens]|uniref:uncharacterized protein RP688-like n=1 Tax=Haliotis rufescens TaxID=6454 RepID=UPI001EB007A9|nr:uncharacterized protein RP688-like [Haliotis rufescens]